MKKTKKELEIERYLKEQQVNYFLRLLERRGNQEVSS